MICGLGNPGKDYQFTRHNLGYMVVDKFAAIKNVSFLPGKGDYLIAKYEKIYIMKPTTYMNNSGIAIKEFLEKNPLKAENILVILDDMDLPLGVIRIRKSGGSGGHKGLESIIYHLQTESIPRLRMGIGRYEGTDPVEWVLSPFTDEEISSVEQAIKKAINAVLTFVNDGIEKAMSQFNKLSKEEV